ncbi:ParB/RepB/Spo0J family partition protein [Longicatena caecimuris]|uniref:ParB/RepB/Spo0J family partition protein n=1 Tax=Longicatena caecimuris TaxID=1796635 RepID=UPI001D015DB8|nr:ParB/RepB/Spo0J family partition protein [Longicatena caecimuris]MCB5394803.1 ParB/RepB/Spo0J family partition protein [Longicatena caecimuris]MCB5565684.1 ParB/RepB/Spo0J family partition protein [Longicatena caecimuris]
MPRKPLSEVQIPDLNLDEDILFKSQKTREEDNAEKVIQIPLDEISDFPNHPFKVREDKAMIELSESIAKVGVLMPALVRPKESGGYEMIAGHRRKFATQYANIETIPCIVRNLSDDEATIIMVDTNLRQRENLLPSEKAFAYKMKLDAMNRQGLRTDLTSCQVGEKLNSIKLLSKQIDESERQIQRYVRLTNLIKPILDMVDEQYIALNPAVEISFLDTSHQEYLLNVMQLNDCTPSHAQTLKMHKLDKEGILTTDEIDNIMAEQKPNQVEKIKIPKNRIKSFFTNKTSEQEIEDTIVKALELYQRIQQKKRSNRESR